MMTHSLNYRKSRGTFYSKSYPSGKFGFHSPNGHCAFFAASMSKMLQSYVRAQESNQETQAIKLVCSILIYLAELDKSEFDTIFDLNTELSIPQNVIPGYYEVLVYII